MPFDDIFFIRRPPFSACFLLSCERHYAVISLPPHHGGCRRADITPCHCRGHASFACQLYAATATPPRYASAARYAALLLLMRNEQLRQRSPMPLCCRAIMIRQRRCRDFDRCCHTPRELLPRFCHADAAAAADVDAARH